MFWGGVRGALPRTDNRTTSQSSMLAVDGVTSGVILEHVAGPRDHVTKSRSAKQFLVYLRRKHVSCPTFLRQVIDSRSEAAQDSDSAHAGRIQGFDSGFPVTSTCTAHPYPNTRLVCQGNGMAYLRKTHTTEQLPQLP